MVFKELFRLFYFFGEKEKYSIFETPQNMIGSFCFAIFFYTLFLFGGGK
jgi:hypothetical protein